MRNNSKPNSVRQDAAALEALVRAMAEGDQAALAQFYDATAARVYGLSLHIARNAQDAEEICIDVFLKTWRDAGRFDSRRGTVMTWLLMICRARAIDQLRTRKETVDVDALAETPDVDSDPQDLLEALDRRRAVHGALSRLPARARQLLVLAFFRGLSHAEIAVHTGVPLGTVKTTLRRALKTLRAEFDPRQAKN